MVPVIVLFCLTLLQTTSIASAQVARVALERELIVVEEALHSTSICVVVTTGTMTVPTPLTLSTLGGSATAGDDFISIFEEEIIFQPGEVRKCVQFTVIEDDIVEGEEALSVQIQSPVVLIGEPQMADINIIDSSRIAIGFTSARFTVREGVQASVCAVIRNGTIGRVVAFIIEALPIGTASPGPVDPDFIAGPVLVNFNQRNPTAEVCASFIIIEDNIPPVEIEADEYFVVSLSSNDNVDMIPGESTAHVVIHDNDGATVRLTSNARLVTEGVGQEAAVCLVLEDIHDRLQREIHFNLSVVALFLASEDDFDPQEMLTITFPANSSVGNTSCTHYTILDDDLKEGEESFRVSVEAVNSLDVIGGEHSTVLITIQEEDGDAIQDCGPPPTPSDGSVQLIDNSTLNGSVVVYSCDEGYRLSAQANLVCLTNPNTVPGIWSAEPPSCNVIDCGVPPNPGANGQVTYSDTTFRASATYICASECYRLQPDVGTRLCLSNGSWSGENPQCNLIECGPPPEIAGCELSIPVSTGCSSEAVYQPQSGFTLEGDHIITCRATGEWRGDGIGFTQCTRSVCPFLPDPVCGSVELSSLSIGSTANFSCDVGCKLSTPGISQTVCMPSEEWLPSPPTCEVVTCPQLANPPNGTVHTDMTLPQPYRTVVNISCNDGYRLEGSRSRMCLSDGVWSGEETHCVFVDCEVVLLENGNTTVNGTGLGSRVEYTCNVGYELVGTSLQVCLEDGTWSGVFPVTCKRIDCGPPPIEDFPGSLEYSNTTYGSSAIYICPGNCTSNSSLCQENGEWTEPALDCYVCSPLQNPENGFVNQPNDSLYPGSSVLYTCDEGYTITNTRERNCTCAGWSGLEPTCVVDITVGPSEPEEDSENDVIVIVVASVGGSVLLVGLLVCCIIVWCCLVKNNPKIRHLRTTKHNNYKGSTPYILPYTIYANRSSTLEPLASNNQNSDIFDIPGSYDSGAAASFRSTDSGYHADQRKNIFPSVRGSEFGTDKSSTARGTNFGVHRQMSSLPEDDVSKWDKTWAETSLSMHPTSDQRSTENFDDSSSVRTTSTLPISEYQRRVQAADEQLNAEVSFSILKKK